jgi:hypothetical protein
VRVNISARRHGVSDDDIVHAAETSVAEYELGDDDEPRRFLILGPDRAGNMLEVIVLMFDDGTELAIHAMAMRPKYASWLTGGKR